MFEIKINNKVIATVTDEMEKCGNHDVGDFKAWFEKLMVNTSASKIKVCKQKLLREIDDHYEKHDYAGDSIPRTKEGRIKQFIERPGYKNVPNQEKARLFKIEAEKFSELKAEELMMHNDDADAARDFEIKATENVDTRTTEQEAAQAAYEVAHDAAADAYMKAHNAPEGTTENQILILQKAAAKLTLVYNSANDVLTESNVNLSDAQKSLVKAGDNIIEFDKRVVDKELEKAAAEKVVSDIIADELANP